MVLHDPTLRYTGVPLREWDPGPAAGAARTIVLHWSGGDYRSVFSAYHYCVTASGGPFVFATHPVANNLRVLAPGEQAPYAAHIAGRNAFAIGLSAMCMRAARPEDFGDFPLTPVLVDALCEVAAILSARYGLAVERGRVFTHAEAALEDGYFGSGADQRWDIARLAPHAAALHADEAARTGEVLRARIRAFAAART